MYIPGALILIILVFCMYKIYTKAGVEQKSGLRRKQKLICEAESVIEKYRTVAWTEMEKSQQDMYTCAMTRLSKLNSLKPHQTVNETLLPDWPESPNL